jgi:hypothetical protein
MIDRRTFMKTGTVGAAIAALPPGIAAQETSAVRFGALPDTPLPTSEAFLMNAAAHPGDKSTIAMLGETDILTAADLSNQFIVFQSADVSGQPTLLEASGIMPAVSTPAATPDVLLDVSLLSFHVADDETVNKDTRATMRLTLSGGDQESQSPLYWAVTAGMQLYDEVKSKRPLPSQFETSFKRALGNRSIAIPTAVGTMKFEVVKHKEPKWWHKVFNFLGSGGGKILTSALGFPGVTQDVIKFIDDAASRFEDNNPAVLFASRPLQFAFSKEAKTASSGVVEKIGALNPGLWIMARGRDFAMLKGQHATYYHTYGMLVPSATPIEDVLAGKANDPLKNVTYAVFKSKIEATKIGITM